MDAGTKTNDRADQAPDLPSLCHAMFEGSPMPVATVAGAKHIVCYANPVFCSLVGKSKSELIGNPFAEMVPGDGCLSLLAQVYRTGKAETHTEPEHAEAHPVYWSYAMWPVLGADERPVGVMIQVTETARFHQQATAMNQELLLSVVRQHELTAMEERLNAQLQLEITEHKRAEKALLRSEKLASVGRMASTIAHEINNPLETVGHAVYLALTDPGTSQQAKSYLDLAVKELERVTHITKQTLAFNREDKTPTLIDLRASVDSIVKLYAPRLKSRGITVVKRYAEVECIRAGGGEIQQVISNLLSNSMDATPNHGKIEFRVSRSIGSNGSRLVRFTIADTGSGIPPEQLKQIFEPFFTTKEIVGTGLGLWVTKQIVEKHGATIRVRSKLGRGTVFSIAFPIAEGTTQAG
jgi:signal transduction histidine kinase